MTYVTTDGDYVNGENKRQQFSLNGADGWFHQPLSDEDLANLDPDLVGRIRATVERAVSNAPLGDDDDDDDVDTTSIPTLHELEADDGGVEYFAVHDGRLYELEGIQWDQTSPKALIERLSLGSIAEPAQEAPPPEAKPAEPVPA